MNIPQQRACAGFAVTSVDAIAEAAGFSRGAVYSNFGSKERLCMAVLSDIYLEELAQIGAAAAAPNTLDEALEAISAWAEVKIGQEGWTLLSLDLASHIRGEAEMRAALDQCCVRRCGRTLGADLRNTFAPVSRQWLPSLRSTSATALT